MPFSIPIIGLSLASIVGLTVIGSGWLIGDSVHAAVASQPVWLQFVEALLLADLGFYLAHRAFHAFPPLWKFHAVHHSIEELDWLAAARVHPVDQIITKGVSFLPVFALGFSDMVIAGWMLSAYVLIGLGRAFSIMAQARRLVTTGPYAIVRHPLYLSEEIAMIGIALRHWSPGAALIVCVQWLFQLRRMTNEESVLRSTFPEYAVYATRTPKVIPRLFPRFSLGHA